MSRDQEAGRIDPLMFDSKVLNRRCTAWIYRSPGYQRGRGRLLYLLHGMTGCEIDWLWKGSVNETADKLVHEGTLKPFAIVMPNDGMTGNGTFYTNWYDGSGRYEDYFIKEMCKQAEGFLGYKGGRGRRGIAGLSMGGYGALALGLRHPAMFCAAASLSGAVETIRDGKHGALGRKIFGPLRGDYRKEREPFWLLTHKRAARRVPIHFNCGRDDFLIDWNRRFHDRLTDAGIDHEYKEYPGQHTWPYWRKRIVPVLKFMQRQWDSQAGK